jgi:hypothetical protein
MARIRAHPVGYPIKPPVTSEEVARLSLAEMPDGASGQVLTAQGAGVDPVYAPPGVDLGSTITMLGEDATLNLDCRFYVSAGLGLALESLSDFTYLLTATDYADKHIRMKLYDDNMKIIGRYTDTDNFYYGEISTAATTADFQLYKITAGTTTSLASEAVDLTAGWFDLVISISGSTIQVSRDGGVIFPLSVTDTDHTSGRYGCYLALAGDITLPISIGAPLSPIRQPIAFFEVPITGDGSENNPYRAKMPEFIEEELELGKVNRLNLSHSSIIPVDDRGHPKHDKALVKILEQPDRQRHVLPIEQCLTELEAIRGVRKIDRLAAMNRAKAMNPELKDIEKTF